MGDENAAKNTDQEIWRRKEEDAFSPSIHVTEGGEIGINVKDYVIVAPVEKWHHSMRRCMAIDEYGRKVRKTPRKSQEL